MKKFAKLLFVALLFIMSLCAITACSTNASNVVSVESISIIGADSIIKNIQEQYTAVITPSNATYKAVTWEIESGTAEISESGVLISTETGTVIIKATAGGQSTTKQITVKDTTNEPSDSLNATFNGFNKVDDTTYEIKVSNNVESLNIANVATINSDWKLTTDMQAINEIPSKIATPLNVGDNNFYVLVSHQNNVRLYTLKIRRKPIYEVTFNTNGGNFINTQQIEEDSFISAPTTPTKTGYEFVAWDKEITIPIVADTIFKSIWKANTYTITYSSNCEIPEFQTQKVVFGNSVVLKDKNCFSRSAYNFVKWNTKADNSGTDYSANFNFSNFNIANDITLYAIWEPVNYSITYNSDGGTHENIITSYNIESPTIALSNAVKIGYSFDGWYTDSEFKNKISSIEVGNYGNLELFAKFTANKYIVTLNANNSDLNQHTIEVTYNQPYELPTPTLEGEWLFNGWDIPSTGVWTWTDKTTITASLTPYYIFSLLNSNNAYELASYNANETQINIPNTYMGLPVTTIGDNAFDSNTSLSNITIPDSITEIGKYAFSRCENLSSVIMSNNIIKIGFGAFYKCSNLSSIVIPKSVTEIGNEAFYGTISLMTIDYNATNLNDLAFSNGIFYDSGKNTVGITLNIGAEVAKIPANLFHPVLLSTSVLHTPKIKTVKFLSESMCESIGANAFAGCTITTLIIPNSVKEIGEYAFSGTSNLTLILSENLSKLGKSAFGHNITVYVEFISQPENWQQPWYNSLNAIYWLGEWHIDETSGEPTPNIITS